MNRYNPLHVMKHLYRNPIFFSNRGGVDNWGHEKNELYEQYKEAVKKGLPNAVPEGVMYFSGDHTQNIPVMLETPIRWVRLQFYRKHLQAPNVWEVWDKAVNQLTANGFKILGILGYDSEDSTTADPEFTQKFLAEYAETIVIRYRDKIKHWEVFNEPFHSFPDVTNWIGNVGGYAKFMCGACNRIKDIQPDCKLMNSLAGRRSDKNIKILKKLITWQVFKHIDIFNYHDYWSEEKDICVLLAWIKENINLPIWITEYGQPKHVSMIDYCKSRGWIYKQGGVEKAFWFYWKEIAENQDFLKYLKEGKK